MSKYLNTLRTAECLPGKEKSDLFRLIVVCLRGLVVFALFYLAFYSVYRLFPYVTSGSDLIARFKRELASGGRPFKEPNRLRIMAFGNSKALAGFIPSLFDLEVAQAGAGAVESYNFGLPGDSAFLAPMAEMLSRGAGPDVALLLAPWPKSTGTSPNPLRFAADDSEIMNRLFPFRKFIRDFALMAAEAHARPGIIARLYMENERNVRQVESDRGYYFIARESHYAADELPPDLRLATDSPYAVSPRTVSGGAVFRNLESLVRAHHVRCILVPSYFREGQYAIPESVNAQTERALEGHPNFGVAGPDYFLYPNRFFSDITHLNREGAKIYTKSVAVLVSQWIAKHPVSRGTGP